MGKVLAASFALVMIGSAYITYVFAMENLGGDFITTVKGRISDPVFYEYNVGRIVFLFMSIAAPLMLLFGLIAVVVKAVIGR